MQQMRDGYADKVERITNRNHPEYESQPGYRVRIAQRQLETADRLLNRVKNEEKVFLDKLGTEATKGAIISLIKGQVLTSDLTGACDLAFGTTSQVSDAYSNRESEHQRRLREKIENLRGRNLAGPLQSGSGPTQDDMDFLIAASELNHIAKQMEQDGLDQNTPEFANQLNSRIEEFYGRKGEAGLPPNIRNWLDTIRAAMYGGTAKKTPADAKQDEPSPAQAVTATGRLELEEMPSEWLQENTMSLTFNLAGGPVTGKGHVVVSVKPDDECPSTRQTTDVTFTGTYSAKSQLLRRTARAHATGVGYVHNGKTGKCQAVPIDQRYSLEWQAELRGQVVNGLVKREGRREYEGGFTLTVQGK